MFRKLMMAAACVMALSAPSHTAMAANRTCTGILTDQRTVGVSLGDCDLNDVTSKDFKRITDACGQPNGVGENTNKTVCKARVSAVQKPHYPGIWIVKKVWRVEQARGSAAQKSRIIKKTWQI